MSMPTSLSGYVDDGSFDTDAYGSVVDFLLEHIPALMHPQSVRTYAAMRYEPQLSASLRAYMLALERGTYTIDPAGCNDETVELIADDLGLPILGYNDDADPDDPVAKVMKPTGARRRGFTWAEHLRLAASLSLTFGHAGFAQQWNDERGRWRLGMVQERMPQTITERKLNPDSTLKSVVQGNGLTGQRAPEITTANHELVWYCREREGTNYFGTSLFRPSYAPWLIKSELMRILPTSHRRNGMGVWQVTAPPGAEPNQIAEANRIARTTKASSAAGMGLPHGFTAELRGMTGTLPDTLGFIQYLDRLETRSMFTSILDMATAERGNRSLGETVMALMVFAQQAEGQRIVDDATQQLVIPLVDANFGEDEPAPRISVTGIGQDQQLTAQDMALLLQYGGLHGDDVLEEDTRRRYGLPRIDHETRADAPTSTTEGGANA